ncbi:MAG: LysM peptidoglycan-binding domain-containing protein [Nocardioidaceae bacterium]|nr:MAG: LysM peptidoglycan-binding domain-containing protein [Nocardioidaceae bacterium]
MQRLIRGIGALIVLVTLLAGAPLALATWWGNPWPTGGWSEAQLLSNDTIVGGIVAAGWVAWVLMTLCIVVEIIATVTRKTAVRIPFALPGQQDFARVLVVSVAALGLGTSAATVGGAVFYSTNAPGPAQAASPAPAITPITPALDSDRADLQAGHPVADTHTGPSITTQSITTAWSIASTHLGRGERWKEVLDLNHGIPFNDGTTFTTGTQTIPAGTILRLPADATTIPELPPPGHSRQRQEKSDARPNRQADATSRTPAGSKPAYKTYTVIPNDTLSEISRDKLGNGRLYMKLFRASKDTLQPGGEHLTDPDLIKPGWIITIPEGGSHDQQTEAKSLTQQHPTQSPSSKSPQIPAQDPAESQSDPSTGPSQAAGPDNDEMTPQIAHSGETGEGDSADRDSVLGAPWVLPGLAGSGVLLAGALLLGLRQQRHAQFRARRPGRAIATPGRELADVEMTITAAGDIGEEPLAYIDTALRRLAGSVYVQRGAMPAVAAVEISTPFADRIGGGRLTVHLSEPGYLPAPWQPTPDRLHWHVPASVPVEDLGTLSEEADAPYPLLVTIGQADSGELWLLNCEDLGTVTLTGDPQRVRDFARHLAVQLAVNPWSQGATIDCFGIAAEAESLADGISYYATTADAARAATDALADAVAMIDRTTGHATDVATGRTGQSDDDVWPSRLLLIDATIEELESLNMLLDLVARQVGRTAISVVLVGDQPQATGTTLQVTAAGRVILEQAGLDLTAVGLTSEEARGVGLVYAQSQVLDDVEIPVDASIADGWEAYADQAGGLRREHTFPRGTSDSELAEPATSLLDGDDANYLTRAPILFEDLEVLAPKVPVEIRTEVVEKDPTLDRDVDEWFNQNSTCAKLSLLGPVIARTHGKPLAKRRAYYTELLAFLWFHRRNGATRDQIVNAFGTPADRVRKDISILRDWLGINPHTDQLYLPPADRSPAAKATGTNVYQLIDEGLLVDWDLFKRLRLRGEARGGSQGRCDLSRALDLVAGRPCDHQRQRGWAWLAEGERHDHYMHHAIADIALTVSTHFLHDDDTVSARAATEVALLASPDEESTRLCLVQIANAEGNRTEAERILVEEVCSRSDDGQAPTDLNDRTKTIIANHHEWKAG